jgi:hypothetical protein
MNPLLNGHICSQTGTKNSGNLMLKTTGIAAYSVGVKGIKNESAG